MGVFDLSYFALISPYSNGAVQIRVGLELAGFLIGSDEFRRFSGEFLSEFFQRILPANFPASFSSLGFFGVTGKGALGLRGVAFMRFLAVLTFLAVLKSTLPSACLSYRIQYQETTGTVLTVFAVSAVVAVSVVTATPLKLNPPFRHPDFSRV